VDGVESIDGAKLGVVVVIVLRGVVALITSVDASDAVDSAVSVVDFDGTAVVDSVDTSRVVVDVDAAASVDVAVFIVIVDKTGEEFVLKLLGGSDEEVLNDRVELSVVIVDEIVWVGGIEDGVCVIGDDSIVVNAVAVD
jgi:hypothetical protein